MLCSPLTYLPTTTNDRGQRVNVKEKG